MLFNSFSFLVFLPIVYALFWGVHYAKGIQHKLKWQHAILLIASYFFYAYWNIWFLVYLIYITRIQLSGWPELSRVGTVRSQSTKIMEK